MKRGITLSAVSAAVLLALTACGGGSSEEEPPQNLSVSVEIDPGHAECEYGGTEESSGQDDNGNGQLDSNEVDQVAYDCNTADDLANAGHDWLGLDILKTGISANAPQTYSLYVPESAESLVIYLASGVAGEAMGDPDLYVKFEGSPTAGQGVDDGTNDCVSYNSSDYNEVCIIDNPQSGNYQILIDASAQVSDATLYATTGLFAVTQNCNDEINLRSQLMNQTEADAACAELIATKTRFDQLINSEINPDFGSPVPNDLNQVTNLHVFGSLSNHMSWVEHLWSSSNSSGIYFETSPTEWWH
ncbi:MAG: PPC domain-containing protein, partial [Kangiellaceae bacterium]|nr:PPC domain-containing protein [Kangiellaceae bacterium]